MRLALGVEFLVIFGIVKYVFNILVFLALAIFSTQQIGATDVFVLTEKSYSSVEDINNAGGKIVESLSTVLRKSYDDLVNVGLKAVEDGNVIKFLDADGRYLAEIVDGKLKFKYSGFGGDVIMAEGKTTTVLGKFFVGIKDEGTSFFLGCKSCDPIIKSFPDGSFSRGAGQVSNPNGMNFLDIPESQYNALIDKHIQKYIAKGKTLDEAKSLGLADGNDEFWDLYNYPFLEDAFKRGDDIRLVSDKILDKTGTYAREIDAIEGANGLAKKYGYSYDSNTKVYSKK